MLSLKDIELGLKGPMESFPFIRLQSVAGWEINKGGQGGGGGLMTSSRTTILRLTSHETNIYVFTLFKIEVVQKFKKLRWSHFSVKQSALIIF